MKIVTDKMLKLKWKKIGIKKKVKNDQVWEK